MGTLLSTIASALPNMAKKKKESRPGGVSTYIKEPFFNY